MGRGQIVTRIANHEIVSSCSLAYASGYSETDWCHWRFASVNRPVLARFRFREAVPRVSIRRIVGQQQHAAIALERRLTPLNCLQIGVGTVNSSEETIQRNSGFRHGLNQTRTVPRDPQTQQPAGRRAVRPSQTDRRRGRIRRTAGQDTCPKGAAHLVASQPSIRRPNRVLCGQVQADSPVG